MHFLEVPWWPSDLTREGCHQGYIGRNEPYETVIALAQAGWLALGTKKKSSRKNSQLAAC